MAVPSGDNKAAREVLAKVSRHHPSARNDRQRSVVRSTPTAADIRDIQKRRGDMHPSWVAASIHARANYHDKIPELFLVDEPVYAVLFEHYTAPGERVAAVAKTLVWGSMLSGIILLVGAALKLWDGVVGVGLTCAALGLAAGACVGIVAALTNGRNMAAFRKEAIRWAEVRVSGVDLGSTGRKTIDGNFDVPPQARDV